MNAMESSAKPKLRKRLIIMIVVVVVIFGLLVAWNTVKGIMIGQFMKSMSNPPQTVSTMTAQYLQWQPTLRAFGNVRAVHGSDLAFDVAGLVKSVDVKSGAEVKRGQLLIELVDAEDRANLAALQATAKLAQLTAERAKKQLAVQAISKAQYDTDMASLKGAQANVAAQQALVDKKTLRAPFAGRIGIITANAGQYISAGSTVATLQQLNPVYIDFTLPQSALEQFQVGGKVDVTTSAFAGKTFDGKVTAINPKVDLATRNVGVEATVPNRKKQLMPGMFTQVEVATGGPVRHLTLPQTAIAYAPYGDTVFVVHAGQPPASNADDQPAKAKASSDAKAKQGQHDASHYVTQVIVKVGPTRGDQVAILSGIKQGDVIVTSGQLKLRNDTPVFINNKVQPAFDPHPHPVEG